MLRPARLVGVVGGRGDQGEIVSNFDEALERFHLGDLEYSGGLANHGPMAAEALERLGHQALIPAFLGLYAPRLPAAEPGVVLSEAEAKAALGDFSRSSDWVTTFEARLDREEWRGVVAASVPELMPGLFAGAGHGFLRTAHAVRSLENEDSPLRRRELARGLAYWSARYQRLPGRPGSGATAVGEIAETFAAWPLVGEPESRSGLFFEGIRRLDRFPDFAAGIERFRRPEVGELSAFLSDLCRLAANAYLAHPSSRIPYVHALTIPSALRLLASHLGEEEACLGGAYVFQAMAAMHSMFGEDLIAEEPEDEVARISNDWDEIRYHAACSIQEHAIKMVEACWREDQLLPDPIFRLAAADAALKIDGRGRAAAC
jgi:hypothetical protein